MTYLGKSIKSVNFEMFSLFGHEFTAPDECVTCEVCCPGSCTGCTQCNSCNMSYAHGEKSKFQWVS